MFGSCVLSRAQWAGCVLLFVFVFLPGALFAQAQKATVINDGALIYQDADFDAPVITTLKLGGVYSISTGKKGPFYKIRVKVGSVGWIADTDVKLGVIKITPEQVEKNPVEEKPRRPFFATRYRGPALEYLYYTEDTLGKERSESLLFYGMKFNGFDTIFDGEIYTDANVLFHFGAPDFYSEATGKSSEGFIVILNFLLQTVLPQGKSTLFFYGFGPTLKISHYSLDVPDGAETKNYIAEDINLGAVFNAGLAFRLGDVSLRTDARYYWEETQYYGLGLNLGWDF